MSPAPALALLLAVLAQDAESTGGPGPLAGIDGIAGFSSVSRIVFPDGSSPPHRLEAVYLFPERARWRLQAVGGRASERMLVYRYGASACQILPARTASTPFRGDALATTILQMELRRAAMIWPHGFEWTGDGAERVTTITSSARGGHSIGTLAATLGEDGRPELVEARSSSGDRIESLAIDAWQSLGARTWPHELRLMKHGRPVWTETVDAVQTRVYFVDLFFQPPDRRAQLPVDPAGGNPIVSVDLQAITFRRRELGPDTAWEKALTRARQWTGEASGEGLDLDPVPTIELGANGRPGGLVQRLARPEEGPPEGWTTVGDRPGLALVLDDLGELTAELLAGMKAAAPPGARPGTPYCRVLDREGPRRVQVYLPLDGP